jgi:hypothetical protein
VPHGVTTQKTPFFIVTAVKTSNLTSSETFTAFHKLWALQECAMWNVTRRRKQLNDVYSSEQKGYSGIMNGRNLEGVGYGLIGVVSGNLPGGNSVV